MPTLPRRRRSGNMLNLSLDSLDVEWHVWSEKYVCGGSVKARKRWAGQQSCHQISHLHEQLRRCYVGVMHATNKVVIHKSIRSFFACFAFLLRPLWITYLQLSPHLAQMHAQDNMGGAYESQAGIRGNSSCAVQVVPHSLCAESADQLANSCHKGKEVCVFPWIAEFQTWRNLYRVV